MAPLMMCKIEHAVNTEYEYGIACIDNLHYM
jgi:hypothetical protein